jgi:hypothetical protein
MKRPCNDSSEWRPEVYHVESLIIAHQDLSVRSRLYRSTRRRKMPMGSTNAGLSMSVQMSLRCPDWFFALSIVIALVAIAVTPACLNPR